MVRFGQARPSVGIVGSYQRSAEAIRWQAVPVGVDVLSGREACRLALLTGAQIFGAPTAFMYRSDLVRKAEAFFPDCQPHADTSACYSALQECDFGFIHEILSVERVHPDQVSSSIEGLGGGCVAYLDVFLKYGRNYLTEEEYIQRMTEVLDTYYRYLGGCALKLRGADFWRFHRSRLDDIGCGLDWSRVARGMVKEVFAEMSTPLEAARKVAQAIRDRRQGR
jgi:hypothetical protein